MPNLAKPAALHALQPQPRPLIQMSPIGVTAALFQKTQAKAVVTLRPLPRNCATKPIFGSMPQALHRAHREKKEILTAFCSGVTNPKAAQLLSASLLLFGSHFAASGGRGTFSPSAMQGLLFARSFVRLQRRLGGCWWQWRRSWWWLRRRLGVDVDCVSCLQVEWVQHAARLQSRKYPRRIVCHTVSCPRTEYVPCWR